MRNSIPYYIREQLREDRSVYLPDLGVFSLIPHSAQLNADKTSISPPLLSLDFNEDIGDIKPLIERISLVENLTIEKASKKLKKYTEAIFNKLVNLNKVQIEGIGTLEKKEDDQILFTDTVAQLTDEYNGLKSINIKPIQRMSRPIQGENANQHDQNANSDSGLAYNSDGTATTAKVKAGRPWWIPILGGVLLALAYIVGQKSCNKDTNGLIGDASDNEKTEKVIANNEDTEEEQISAEEAVTGEIEAEDGREKGMGTTSAEEINAESTKEETEIKETVVPKEVAAISDNSTLTDKIEKTSKPTSKNNSKSTSPTNKTLATGSSIINSVSYDGQTCVIIVGSFKKAKNVLRMANKVESIGYQSFQEAYGDFTRVGLQFNCRAEDLDKYLAEVRTKLESQAWYLKSPKK